MTGAAGIAPASTASGRKNITGPLVLLRGLPQWSFVAAGPEFYPRVVLVIMALLCVMPAATDR